ncbi:hypothetical protein BaRGS_00007878, partial [Batillaria attramentaria]
ARDDSPFEKKKGMDDIVTEEPERRLIGRAACCFFVEVDRPLERQQWSEDDRRWPDFCPSACLGNFNVPERHKTLKNRDDGEPGDSLDSYG